MEVLVALIGLAALAAVPVCLIMIIVQAVRKKPRKKWVIAAISSVVVFILAIERMPTCEHVWEEATCENAKTCSLCGDYEGESLGHDSNELKPVKEATCTEVGRMEGCCTRCGEVIHEDIPKKEHQMGEQRIIKEATCEAVGEIEQSCEYCGYIEKASVSATGHTDGEWEITEVATYDNAGTRSVFCVKCDAFIRSESYELSEEEKEDAFLDMCDYGDYESIARYPERFVDAAILFEGEVVQVVEENDEYILRVNVTWNGYYYEDTIWVEYTRKDSDDGRILEGDIVSIYGYGADVVTYESVLGSSITIPAVSAMYIYYKY